ncbi:MAG: hypothetical protein QM756_20340 [Polyangiaceae bacterium]
MANQTYGSRFAGPEKSTSYEAGIKADWGLATANLAVFKQNIAASSRTSSPAPASSSAMPASNRSSASSSKARRVRPRGCRWACR